MKAIYAGSFDPFTNGHLDIVKKASKIFDEICIVIAVNANKSRTYNSDEMCEAIEQTLLWNDINNCKVGTYNGLIVELTRGCKCKYLIRGLRNAADYNYEENMAKVNSMLDPNVETIYFRADNDTISSSLVRELYGLGHDVSSYVPRPVLKLMEGPRL